MKHWVKVLWICIGLAFVAGVIIAAAAFFAGAKGILYFNSTGIHAGTQRGYESSDNERINEMGINSLQDIEINLVEADVHITESDNFGYEIIPRRGDSTISATREGANLIISEDYQAFFGINLGSLFDLFTPHLGTRVTLFVPKNADLNSIVIQTVSGSIQLDATNLKITDFVINTVSGDFTANPGDTQVTNLSLNSVSGRLDYFGTVTGSLSCDMVSGVAVAKLFGQPSDYAFELDAVSGSVSVNGERLRNGASDWPAFAGKSTAIAADKRISVHLISGKVELEFL
jgi:hypothetical protein